MTKRLTLENMNEMLFISGWFKKYLISTLTKQEYDVRNEKGEFRNTEKEVEVINPLDVPRIILYGKKLKLEKSAITLPGNKLYALGLISPTDAGLFVEYRDKGLVPATKEDLSKEIYIGEIPDEEDIREHYFNQQLGVAAMLGSGGWRPSKKEMAEKEKVREKAIQRELKKAKDLERNIKQGHIITNIIYDPNKENKKACTMPSIKISGYDLVLDPESGNVTNARELYMEVLKHGLKIHKGKLEKMIL